MDAKILNKILANRIQQYIKKINMNMKKCSASLAIREIQIKTTMRTTSHYWMGIINRARKNKCWRGCAEKGRLLHFWWEWELVQPLWKTVWRFLKELKIDLPYDPATSLLGIYAKDTDAMKRRDTCTPMFIAAMSTIAKLWKEPRCPLKDEWIKKMWFIYPPVPSTLKQMVGICRF